MSCPLRKFEPCARQECMWWDPIEEDAEKLAQDLMSEVRP